MSRLFSSICLLLTAAFLSAQTYVWKGGRPVLSDPDSITFVKPDMGAAIREITEYSGTLTIRYLFLTKDYQGNPQWQSALLYLDSKQVASKHVSAMAMYNHYTIMSANDAPTAGVWDLQLAAQAYGMAVVCADYEGFGETIDRPQAYCFAEANARASIDAVLAAREWLVAQGYTLSDSIVNYGYSQGAQTTVAAIKLSQTEYKNRIRFLHSVAGDGPYDLRLTYNKFLEWQKVGQVAAMPLMVITLNELFGLKLNYKDLFLKPLDTGWKIWFLSKKFNTDEAAQLMGVDSIRQFIAPAYCDTATAEMRALLQCTDNLDFTRGWTPDSDTRLAIYHSKADDTVPFENGRELYRFFQSNGCSSVTMDSTTLYNNHLQSGTMFLYALSKELSALVSK